MKKFLRTAAGLLALASAMSVTFSCNKKGGSSSVPETTAETTEAKKKAVDLNITWLSYYDINPSSTKGEKRSPALALYQDNFGGTVKYIKTDRDNLYTKLSEMIKAGDEVDMCPYEPDCFPAGAADGLFAPLDDYYEELGMNTKKLWDDMKPVADTLAYGGKHYVIPYALTDPFVLTYSRKLVQDEGLDDPLKLYKENKWDWDTFMNMMTKFKEKDNPGEVQRYGIAGRFGHALLQSTGTSVVTYDGTGFKNNINDKSIEKAELLLKEIADKQLYRINWTDHFPEDKSTLFYAMQDWSLSISNTEAEGNDLMVVPFPKAPDADKCSLWCDMSARMLVKNSTRPEAVATFIMCERYAATDKKFTEAAKQEALTVKKGVTGQTRSFISEEQYNALQSYLDPKNLNFSYDFAYGMGKKMSGMGDYTYETKGVMDKLAEEFLSGSDKYASWEELRKDMSPIIDKEIEKYNKQ